MRTRLTPILFGVFRSTYPKNSTGRSPIFILALLRSCTDRAAHFTPKNSTGRSPIFILALFRSFTDRAAQVTPENSTGRSPFFFCVFYGPLGSEVECVYCWRLVGLKGQSSSSHMWRQRASCCLTRTCVLSKGTRCNNSGCCR